MTRKQPELQTNVIICGDCERRMKERIPNESIDLIYLDPPFFSGKDYDLIWGKGKDKSKATIKVFEDAALFVKKCGECGRIWRKNPRGEFYKTCGTANCKGKLDDAKDVRMSDINVFVEWMRPRIEECYRVLKPTGSIYCHIDWHSVHYMKVMMDEIFGYDNLRSEIIWQRTKVVKGTSNSFGNNHDTILTYSKSNDYLFNTLYNDDEKVSNYMIEPETGRKFTTSAIFMPGKSPKKLIFKDVGEIIAPENKRFRWSQETYNNYIKENPYVVYWSKNKVPRKKDYLDEFKGIQISNIWTDIGGFSSASKERLGYPTQKPEILLERIIKASSNKGDIILDPFCGCGTAVVVAQKLGRKWIGIDVEPLSCTVMQYRLGSMKDRKIKVDIIDLKKTLTEKEANDIIVQSGRMNGHDFQEWIVNVINGIPNPRRSGDRGIDGWINEPLTGKMLKKTLENGDPIQVKMMDKVGGPVIRLFAADMQDYSDHGVIIAYGFANTANKEVEIAYKKHGVKIELITVRDILMLTDKEHVKEAAKLPKGQEFMSSFI